MKASSHLFSEQHRDYQRIAKAIDFINAAKSQPPSLESCAQHVNLSPAHFHKLFSRWAGVSPKQYMRFLQKEHARQCLLESSSLLQAAQNSHLSSTGRLYDLFIHSYGMTPGEYRNQGKTLNIDYGFHQSPFGECLLATTQKGICKLAFFDSPTEKQLLLDELQKDWALASLNANQRSTAELLPRIFKRYNTNPKVPLKLVLKGTQFQIQVWEALLSIPSSQLHSYNHVAQIIQQAKATRAVSSAIANNQIGWLIPCHRVIRQNGDFNQYRWGSTRKQAMIAWEASQEL